MIFEIDNEIGLLIKLFNGLKEYNEAMEWN